MTYMPTVAQMDATKAMIKCGVELGKIRSDYQMMGHKDTKNTLCPGDKLYAEIQSWPHYSNAI